MNIEKNQKIRELENKYNKKLLTLDEVSDYLGLENSFIRDLVKVGSLKAIKSRKEYFFKSIQVINFELDVKENTYIGNEKEVMDVVVSKGSIYKVQSKKNPLEMAFTVTFPNGEKKRVKVRGKDCDALQQLKERKVHEEIQKFYEGTEKSISKSMTFNNVADEWFNEFILDQKSKGGSYSHIESTKCSLNAARKAIGERNIIDIDSQIAQQMILNISKKEDGEWKSKSHVKKVLMAFMSVMDYAIDKGYIENRIKKPILNKNLHEPKKDDRFLTNEEVKKLLMCVKENPFYSTLINLMLSSGLRQEEALALDIGDLKKESGKCMIHVSKAVIEVEKNRYEVVGKLKHNEEPRKICIADDVYDMVVNYYNKCMENKNLKEKRIKNGTQNMIFTNKKGCVHNKRTLYHSLRNFLDRNGGPKALLHMLRHTFASLMCEEIKLEEVSEILGHKDISITQKFYKSTTPEQQIRASKGVNRMMKKLREEGNI